MSSTALRGAPHIGGLPGGPLGTIADVQGVTVGHCTLDQDAVQTGVTVIRPHDGDPFLAKVPAAASVINGFGKSIGLVQVEELGMLETPIALTNTFGVAAVAQAQIRAAIRSESEDRARVVDCQSAGVRMQRRLSERYPGTGRQRAAFRRCLCCGQRGCREWIGRRGARHVVLRSEGRHRQRVARGRM